MILNNPEFVRTAARCFDRYPDYNEMKEKKMRKE